MLADKRFFSSSPHYQIGSLVDLVVICSISLAITVLVLMLDAYSAFVRSERVRVGDVVGAVVYTALQVLLFSWASQDLIIKDEGASTLLAVVACNFACLFAAHAALVRNGAGRSFVGAARRRGGSAALRVLSAPVAVLMLLFVGVLCVLALEMPHNHDLTLIEPTSIVVEWGLLTTVLVALYFLAQRRGFLAILVPIACAVMGIAEFFAYLFKGMPIQPGDMLALSTAASVAGGYAYTISDTCLWGVVFGVFASLACFYLNPVKGPRNESPNEEPGVDGGEAGAECAESAGAEDEANVQAPSFTDRARTFFADALLPRLRRIKPLPILGAIANVAVGVVLLLLVRDNVSTVDYATEYNIELSPWSVQLSYSQQAYLPTFISACQLMKPDEPEGYSVEEAENLLDEYVERYDSSEYLGASETRMAAEQQFDEVKPTVICVMNETFSDLGIYGEGYEGYPGLSYFYSMGDCLLKGNLYVSVLGGSTTNSEFEFLTGSSMANFGSGVYPYNVYNLTETENLAGLFKSMGYDTLAMHPNEPNNWNRLNVYSEFGFDEFLSIEDFEGADTLRGHVTDRATYDMILDRLASDSDPQFIFDVTMQNHSGYFTGEVPEEYQVDVNVNGGYDQESSEYVSVVERSDADLQYFIEQLSQLDRPVIVCFFGDHQPYFTGTHNDEWFVDEDEVTHVEREYQTVYMIWANYDVAGNDQVSEWRDLSASGLSSYLMQLSGAPLSPYQKAHMTLADALPILNSVGYEDANGAWHLDGEKSNVEATDEALEDYAVMEFYEMFGDGKNIYNTLVQDVANH